jgi:uncharacterized protein YndB with AHSA1/START domain
MSDVGRHAGSLAPVLRAARVERPVDVAFAVFTEQIGAWWPLPTHSAFHDAAGAVGFEDGHLVERAVDGRVCVWGEVVEWDPPHRLVFTWHPGRPAEDASEVEVRFAEDGAGTRVELEHRGWERYGEDAVARRRDYVGPGAWGHVLDHFADGAEPRVDAPDLTALEAAAEAFFAEAEAGGFGPPPDGEWDAGQVLAHVALNDLAMTAMAHAIVQGRPRELTFTNVVCQDRPVLDAFVADCGDLLGLVRRGRALAALTRAAVSRLDADQLATPVHCRLLHDGEVVLDHTLPWGRLALDTQATRHLPAHTGQLRDLRPRPEEPSGRG